MTEAVEAGTEAKGEKKGRSMLLLIIIAVVVIAAGGAGAYFFFMPKAQKAEVKEEKKTAVFLDMKDLLIGIVPDMAQTTIGTTRLLKLHVALEIADPKELPAIQALQPRIEDVFQVYLREMRPVDFQGSAAMIRLKDELLKRVNLAVQPNHIDAVLIKELLVQ
jgi:flagellar FliL protein